MGETLHRFDPVRPVPLERNDVHRVLAGAQQQLAVGNGKHVERHDGERVGVEGGEQRDGKVLFHRDREQRRGKHLQRTGHQPGEQADGEAARDRMAVEVPQVRVMQPRALCIQPRQVPVGADGILVG